MRAILLVCALVGLSSSQPQLFQHQRQPTGQFFNTQPVRQQFQNPPQRQFRPSQQDFGSAQFQRPQNFVNQQPSSGRQSVTPQQPFNPQFQAQQSLSNQQFQGQQFQQPLNQQSGRQQFSGIIQSTQDLLRSFLQRELEQKPQPDPAHVQNPQQARILKYDNEEFPPEAYSYSFDTSDGIHKDEIGVVRNAGTDNEALAVQGSYSYIGPDGKEYTVSYTADENGFQPAGEHIPPAANVRKTPQLGVPSAALASLAGGGLG
ncbi:putative mediator of RNA polymerase II transcription subunit 26 [Cylas formicarius]|uniref:putative mediator of RNA polymerase II transcription subunit 26 n=1 Tax=Cylas formicarius TaxID=197179 RepID=UPI002958C81F|nr:putative mediator of RNA polymerase II transcription subunit 26 [Cylas formicarius]